MGNSQGKNSKYTILEPKSWKVIQNNILAEILSNQQFNLVGQRYQIQISDFSKEVQIYQFRKDNPLFLVTVYQIKICAIQDFCSGNCTIDVITQRIPYRLSDLGQLSFKEGLYMLFQVLNGAQLLHRLCGGVFFDENMICINNQGQCKVWLNENIVSNKLLEQQIISETEIIIKICQLLIHRIHDHQGNLSNLVKSKSFSKAIRNVKQMIEKLNFPVKSINIPKNSLKQGREISNELIGNLDTLTGNSKDSRQKSQSKKRNSAIKKKTSVTKIKAQNNLCLRQQHQDKKNRRIQTQNQNVKKKEIQNYQKIQRTQYQQKKKIYQVKSNQDLCKDKQPQSIINNWYHKSKTIKNQTQKKYISHKLDQSFINEFNQENYSLTEANYFNINSELTLFNGQKQYDRFLSVKEPQHFFGKYIPQKKKDSKKFNQMKWYQTIRKNREDCNLFSICSSEKKNYHHSISPRFLRDYK